MDVDDLGDGLVVPFDRARCPFGCLDQYYCPSSGEVECPRHGGFDTCCDHPERHIPVAAPK